MSLLDSETPGAIGAYTVEGILGRGGGGTVYRGSSPQGVPVAIKVPQLYDAEDAARFERECRLQHQLGGDGLLPLLDAGHTPRGPYAVFPLLLGGSLADRLHRGPLPWDKAVALVGSLAGVVARLHAAGVVHRDLKPDNVLFDVHGGAWVADLGASKHADRSRAPDSVSLSQSGRLTGTPAYMAPEQAFDSKHVGPPADVFALGAILYAAIAGERPFPGESLVEIVQLSSAGRYTPLRERCPQVPAWLDLAVRRCLAATVEERPTASELVELLSLGDVASGAATSAHAATRGLVRPSPARRIAIYAGALLVLAGLIGGAAWALADRSPSTVEPPAPTEPRPAVEGPRTSSPLHLVDLDSLPFTPGRLAPTSPPAKPGAPTVLWPVLGGHLGSVHCVALSPDERAVATGSASGELRLFSAKTGADLWGVTLGAKSAVTGVGFLGTHLVAVTAAGELVFAIDGQPLVTRASGHPRCTDLHTVPQRAMATAGPDGVRLWARGHDPKGGEAPPLLVRGDIHVVRLRAQGGGVAIGPEGVWRWEAGGVAERVAGRSFAQPVVSLAWSGGGDTLAALSQSGELSLHSWPTLDSVARQRVDPAAAENPYRDVCFSNQGDLLYTVGSRGNVSAWQVSSLDPATPASFAPQRSRLRALSVRSDGTLYLVGEGSQLLALSPDEREPLWPRNLQVQRRTGQGRTVWAQDCLAWLDTGQTIVLNSVDDLQAVDVGQRRLLDRRGTFQAGRTFCVAWGRAFSVVGPRVLSSAVRRQGDVFVLDREREIELVDTHPTDLQPLQRVLYLVGQSTLPGEDEVVKLWQYELATGRFEGLPFRLTPMLGGATLGGFGKGRDRVWVSSDNLSVGLALEGRGVAETPPQILTDRRFSYVASAGPGRVLLVDGRHWSIASLVVRPGGSVELEGSNLAEGLTEQPSEVMRVYGSQFALINGGQIEVRSLKAGELVHRLPLPPSDVAADFLWSPAGEKLYVWTHRGQLLSYDLP